MCLIVFAHECHPRYRLILAANRDEFHARPTAALAEWDYPPGVIGGRDLRGGGTWLAVTRSGRWAAVTNFRDPAELERQAASRGHLVSRFVAGERSPENYLNDLGEAAEYNGFNLLVGVPGEVWWTSNRGDASPLPRKLAPGIYGVSNHLLDTPWPKVVRAKAALRELVASGDPTPDTLLDPLLDRTFAAEHDLPSTGIASELERALSPAFISLPDYGTRSSTALLIENDGTGLVAERRYDPAGRIEGESIADL